MNISSGKIIRPQKVVIYGPEGIGKTSLAAKFPNPLFIDTEGGSSHLDVRRLDSPSSWTMLVDQIKWVKMNPTVCDTLVIDTADWAETLCIQHVIADGGSDIKGIEDFGYGKGYVYLAEEFGRFLNLLSDLPNVGINIVLTAHSKVKKFEAPEETVAYDRWELKLSESGQKKVTPLVKEWSDAVLFINYKIIVESLDDKGQKARGRGGKRVIYSTHQATWDAKNRWGLSDEIPLDYAAIAPHIPARSSIPCVPAPAEQSVHQAQPPVAQDPSTHLVAGPGQTMIFDKIDNAKVIPTHLVKLHDLMLRDSITDEQLRAAVARQGHKTFETPMGNYEPGFADWLVAQWPKVKEIIRFNEPVPFDK